jgi:RsiW-degrading membrane proteinase PrsW (M82 family)
MLEVRNYHNKRKESKEVLVFAFFLGAAALVQGVLAAALFVTRLRASKSFL